MHKVQTRKDVNCSLFGTAADLDPQNAVLPPTYEDVIRCYFYTYMDLKGDGSKKPSTSGVASVIAKKIKIIWERASLPTVSYNRICAMIASYHTKYRNIIKPKKGRNTAFLNSKLLKFKNDAARLFDVCSCKCSEMGKCTCEKERKIAPIEWPFLQDQRTVRKMGIGRIDRLTTEALQKKMARNSKFTKSSTADSQIFLVPSTSKFKRSDAHESRPSCESDVSSSATSDSSSSSDEEFKWSYPLDKNKSKLADDLSVGSQMRTSMVNTAKSADLTGVSNRAVAKISTAVLEDLKLVSKENKQNVVDKNKIRRAIAKNRKLLQDQDLRERNKRFIFRWAERPNIGKLE